MLTPSSIGSVVVLFWTSLKPAFYFRGRGYSSPPLNWGGFLFELREPWQGAVSIMSTRWRRIPHPVGKGPQSVSERNLADSWKLEKGKPDYFGLYFSALHIYI